MKKIKIPVLTSELRCTLHAAWRKDDACVIGIIGRHNDPRLGRRMLVKVFQPAKADAAAQA